jgi:hypothetical protein
MVVDAELLFRFPNDRVLLGFICAKAQQIERAVGQRPTIVCVHPSRFGGIKGARIFGMQVVFSSEIPWDRAYLQLSLSVP